MKSSKPADARLPKNYALVLDVINDAGKGVHLRTSDIFVAASRRRPGIGFSTVHRGLARLHELGLIARIDVAGTDAAAYEPAGEQHAHFHCTRCGAISDLDYALPSRVRRELGSTAGAEVTGESLTLTGRCARCRHSG